MDIGKDFMTRKEVAAYIQKDVSTITKWYKAGLFPAPARKISCRTLYWAKSDILDWLAGKETSKPAEA